MSMSRKQLALVHVAKKQLGLSEEDYRTILRDCGHVESSKDLSQIGFEMVMKHMASLGFRSDFTRTFYGHRRGMATPAQVSLIRTLWSEYTEGEGDDASLGKWLARTFKVSSVRFVTREQAPKAITALKAMSAKKAAGDQAVGNAAV